MNKLISRKLLEIVLDKEISSPIEVRNNRLTYSFGFNEIQFLNLDTLNRLCKEWLTDGTNDIINTFNSTSIDGWVCTSSIYNLRCISKTELGAILDMTNLVAEKKGLL